MTRKHKIKRGNTASKQNYINKKKYTNKVQYIDKVNITEKTQTEKSTHAVVFKQTLIPYTHINTHNNTQRSVRNNTLFINNKNSYDTWEYAYMSHLLDLTHIIKKYSDILKINTESCYFLENFCHFIRDCSTGEISKYIEPLNNLDEEFYFDFKRNTI